MLSFFIYKTFKQINKTPIESSRERRECVYQGEDIWMDKFCDKAAKTSKKTRRSNKNGYVINKY